MGFRPKLVDDLFYSEKAGKHLFLNPAVPDWIVVNGNGAYLLSRCDGKTTAEGIASSCGAPLQEAEALFHAAAQRNIVDGLAPIPDAVRRPNRMESAVAIPHDAGHPRLHAVHWQLTNECNLRCRYCYAESGKYSERLSLEELLRTADEISELAPSVDYVLSGGEPLLHPDALEFGEHLKAAGNSVSLLTNGTKINAANADRIVAFADRIRISLDGASDEVHAKTRGKHNYAAVVAAVEMLIERGANVQVAMTVHRGNRQDIDAMTRRYGGRLVFQPLFQAGRGAKRDDLALTGAEYYDALASTENVAPMDSIGAMLERLRGRGVERCAMAEGEVSIAETGDVYPCQMLAVPEFCAGNVRKSRFADIYYNSKIFNQARGISIRTLEKCADCPIRRLCAGGCRARDYYEIGTISGVGDFCEYEQKAFLNGLFESVTFDQL